MTNYLPSRRPPKKKYLNYCAFNYHDMVRLALASTAEERQKALVPVIVDDVENEKNNEKSKSEEETFRITKEDILKIQPMSLLEEVVTTLFLSFLFPPCGVITIPVITVLIGKLILNDIGAAFKYLSLLVLLPLTILPQRFVPATVTCRMAWLFVKYFSFRLIFEEATPSIVSNQKLDQKTARPVIYVAPPHGIFPYGNIATILAWPVVAGFYIHGLAANSALRVPIFKQILKSIGTIDASRESAQIALQEYPYAIGIATGGVAEIFETNETDECIILKERIGVIKLAIRTGADIVPCYIYGNTSVLSCWAGEGVPKLKQKLKELSRKVGFGLIYFYGRWYLPIPRRIPLLFVKGTPIPTYQYNCEVNPSMEQINIIQTQLIEQMDLLFNSNKHYYGWNDKKLVIK